MFAAESETPVSDFLLYGGGVTAGGGALGALAAVVGWALAAPILRLAGRVVGRQFSAATFAGYDLFLKIGGGVGGVVGFLIFVYEKYELI